MHTLENIVPTEFDKHFTLGVRKVHLISRKYNLLLSKSSPSMQCLKAGWEKELGMKISYEVWKVALEKVYKWAANSRHCLMQFQIVHKLYYSKASSCRYLTFFAASCLIDVSKFDPSTVSKRSTAEFTSHWMFCLGCCFTNIPYDLYSWTFCWRICRHVLPR